MNMLAKTNSSGGIASAARSYHALATVAHGYGLSRARLRVVIFLGDHEPAHVHVFGEGQAKVAITRGGGASEFAWGDGMTRGEARRTSQVVEEQQVTLLRRREEYMSMPTGEQVDEALKRGS